MRACCSSSLLIIVIVVIAVAPIGLGCGRSVGTQAGEPGQPGAVDAGPRPDGVQSGPCTDKIVIVDNVQGETAQGAIQSRGGTVHLAYERYDARPRADGTRHQSCLRYARLDPRLVLTTHSPAKVTGKICDTSGVALALDVQGQPRISSVLTSEAACGPQGAPCFPPRQVTELLHSRSASDGRYWSGDRVVRLSDYASCDQSPHLPIAPSYATWSATAQSGGLRLGWTVTNCSTTAYEVAGVASASQASGVEGTEGPGSAEWKATAWRLPSLEPTTTHALGKEGVSYYVAAFDRLGRVHQAWTHTPQSMVGYPVSTCMVYVPPKPAAPVAVRCSPDGVGGPLRLLIDANDKVHLLHAFGEAINQSPPLRYWSNARGSWVGEGVPWASGLGAGRVGFGQPALAVDDQGRPHVAIAAVAWLGDKRALLLGSRGAAGWTFGTLDADVADRSTVALSIDGDRLHVAYFGATTFKLARRCR